jgi:hypothetical protein
MKEAQFSRDTMLPGASAGSATITNLTGKEDKASEAQMDYDWANDDLLGEDHELNEATRSFLGIKKRRPDKCEKCGNNFNTRLRSVVSTSTHTTESITVF